MLAACQSVSEARQKSRRRSGTVRARAMDAGGGWLLARTASGVGLNLQNSGAAVPNWSRFLISVNKLSGH
jgi:hypothetical protein